MPPPDPMFGAAMSLFQSREGIDDAGLCRYLRTDEAGLDRLRLCRMPEYGSRRWSRDGVSIADAHRLALCVPWADGDDEGEVGQRMRHIVALTRYWYAAQESAS